MPHVRKLFTNQLITILLSVFDSVNEIALGCGVMRKRNSFPSDLQLKRRRGEESRKVEPSPAGFGLRLSRPRRVESRYAY